MCPRRASCNTATVPQSSSTRPDDPANDATEKRSLENVKQSSVSFGALRQGDFRAYFCFTMLAMMADNIEHVISYWVIYELFQWPELQGFAVISHWSPFLLLSWYVGLLSDRFDCRRVIQWAMILYFVLTIAWAYFIMTGTLRVWHACALLVVHGVAGVLWSPGSQLILHDMVGPEYLQSAVRLSATGRQLGILMGPALGGYMMLTLGAGWGLVVNALFYLPLTLWLSTVPYTGHGPNVVQRRRVTWARALEALREARSNHVIVSMVCLVGLSSLLVGNAFQAQMPGFAASLGKGEVGYSILLAANGAGAFVSGVLLESQGFLQARARTAIVLAILWCVALGIFAFTPYYYMAVGLLFAAGFLNLAFLTMSQTLVQLISPAHLRGQLIGLFIMSGLGLRTFSGITVGIVGGTIGIQWSLGLSCAVLLAVMLLLLVVTARTRGDEASA